MSVKNSIAAFVLGLLFFACGRNHTLKSDIYNNWYVFRVKCKRDNRISKLQSQHEEGFRKKRFIAR